MSPISLIVWCGERKGLCQPRLASASAMPAAECTPRISRNSSASGAGRIVGIRFAISDFPEPGGPIISRLCPPAAATSTARRMAAWPLTSAKSGWPSADVTSGAGFGISGVAFDSPLRNRNAPSSVSAGMASMPPTSEASSAEARGRMTPRRPALRARIAIATPPRRGRVAPLRPSSPAMR